MPVPGVTNRAGVYKFKYGSPTRAEYAGALIPFWAHDAYPYGPKAIWNVIRNWEIKTGRASIANNANTNAAPVPAAIPRPGPAFGRRQRASSAPPLGLIDPITRARAAATFSRAAAGTKGNLTPSATTLAGMNTSATGPATANAPKKTSAAVKLPRSASPGTNLNPILLSDDYEATSSAGSIAPVGSSATDKNKSAADARALVESRATTTARDPEARAARVRTTEEARITAEADDAREAKGKGKAKAGETPVAKKPQTTAMSKTANAKRGPEDNGDGDGANKKAKTDAAPKTVETTTASNAAEVKAEPTD